jgi:GTP cyclohydrolase IIa
MSIDEQTSQEQSSADRESTPKEQNQTQINTIPNQYRTQITVIQIDDYGPYTAEPEPRYEMDLQSLQADIRSILCANAGAHGAYVLNQREDNFIAFTNGMNQADLERVQTSIENQLPVSVSITTDAGIIPAEATTSASQMLQAEGSAQSQTRTEVLKGNCAEEDSRIIVAHWDIASVTEKVTDETGPIQATIRVKEWSTILLAVVRTAGGVGAFVGGDNAITAMPPMASSTYRKILDRVEEKGGFRTRVGVGIGTTAEQAGIQAKHSLEEAREKDIELVIPESATEELPLNQELPFNEV